MKTLDQIEPRTPISSLPFTITNSGSYYLTTNLTGTGTASGIILQGNASDVTVDLNGFALVGGSSSSFDFTTSGSTSNLVVFNGTVRNWLVGLALGPRCRLERLQVVDNRSGGGLGTGNDSIQ